MGASQSGAQAEEKPKLPAETPTLTEQTLCDDNAREETPVSDVPLDIVRINIASTLPPAVKFALATQSRFFEGAYENPLDFHSHLREVLRNEKPLYPLPGNDDASAAATQCNELTPSQESDLKHVLALFTAYQAYFEHYLAMYMPYEDSGYKTWPTESMDECERLFTSLNEKEAALPVKLIQGTGLGVLQATAQYLNSFASMANNNKFNWDELDKLAVQDLGGAQKAAGDSIVDLYFRGDSMTEESQRSSTSWAANLVSKLGSKWWLLIYNGRPRGSGRGAARADDGRLVARNSLSLIKVLTAKLDLSLRHEAARADENDQALPSP
jgi:hypothetical protein